MHAMLVVKKKIKMHLSLFGARVCHCCDKFSSEEHNQVLQVNQKINIWPIPLFIPASPPSPGRIYTVEHPRYQRFDRALVENRMLRPLTPSRPL